MMKATAMEALRRFWWVVVLFALAGAVIGALPEPSTTKDATITYRAQHTLLVSSDSGSIFSDPTAVNQLVLFATTGEVPERAAATLGFASAGEVSSKISTVTLDSSTGALVIEARDTTEAGAERVADTLAAELTTYITELQQNQATDRAAALLARATSLEADIKELQQQLAANPEDSILRAQLDARTREYSVVFEQQNATERNRTGTLTLNSLQFADAFPVAESAGLGAPTSRAGRGAWGFVLGALLGAGAALAMSRLDRRVRSRAQAELLFGGEASVVIPDVGDAGSSLAVRPDRHDQLSDSYRTLRSVLAFAEAGRTALHTDAPKRGSIILVVSPGSGDGKTSIAANLSAAMVEANKRTAAVNSDFRRPSLALRLLGEDPPPLPFTFGEITHVPPSQLLRSTATPNLVLFDLSSIDASPGNLARATTRLLEPLSKIADTVVIDSSPVGATAEVLELLPYADHVVVAIRLDHTLTTATQRSMQLLRSLTTGTLQLVVVGENIERSPYYEYGNPKGKKRQKGGRRERRHPSAQPLEV